jgi:hypothetical protein
MIYDRLSHRTLSGFIMSTSPKWVEATLTFFQKVQGN